MMRKEAPGKLRKTVLSTEFAREKVYNANEKRNENGGQLLSLSSQQNSKSEIKILKTQINCQMLWGDFTSKFSSLFWILVYNLKHEQLFWLHKLFYLDSVEAGRYMRNSNDDFKNKKTLAQTSCWNTTFSTWTSSKRSIQHWLLLSNAANSFCLAREANENGQYIPFEVTFRHPLSSI